MTQPRKPVVGIVWSDARSYCRFLGKELPSSKQWQKALRGGEMLPDGTPNPRPRRNLPWGDGLDPMPASVGETAPSDIGTHPGDVSPYGVLDLAGSVTEWTDTLVQPGIRVVRGGNWGDMKVDDLVDYNAVENFRAQTLSYYVQGFRCASTR